MTIKQSSCASILDKLARSERVSEGLVNKGSIFRPALHLSFWIAVALLATLCFYLTIKPAQVFAWAADCRPEDSGENYIGVRYKALLVEDELSETGWVLLFAGSGFTNSGEYQPHFVDLMIKAGWANLYDDELCASGFPAVIETRPLFNIEFGISDYEDGTLQDNDIAMSTQDPELFPRIFTNIDSRDPNAADKIMATYQVDEGGALEGREIEVSLERGEITTLPPDGNYFMDPDLEGANLCKACSQDDIQYRRWIATLNVPSLGIDSSVDLYINASQGNKLRGDEILNFVWENPGRTAFESDKYKVIIYDIELKTTSGAWQKAEKYLVDLRAAPGELPFNDNGELVGGYRRTDYKGQPAIEASFGYGYNDYVIDDNPYGYELTDDTKGVIDLTTPNPVAEHSLTIDSTDGGAVISPGEGTSTYDKGTVADLVGEPADGYRFVNWTGDVDTIFDVSAAATTITMNGDYSITANFEVIPPAHYSLTISSTSGGAVITPGEGTFARSEGTLVNLVAEAEEGYRFVVWTGDVDTVANVNAASTTVAVQGDYTIRADFADIPPPTNWRLIGGVIAAVVALGLGVFLFRRGKVA